MSVGLGGRARRRSRCAAGSCWRRPTASRARRSRRGLSATSRQSASGGAVSRAVALTGCMTSRGRASRARSATRRSSGDRQDARGAAAGCNALVDAVDGGGDRHEPDRGQPHLAGVRVEAAPDRGVQFRPGCEATSLARCLISSPRAEPTVEITLGIALMSSSIAVITARLGSALARTRSPLASRRRRAGRSRPEPVAPVVTTAGTARRRGTALGADLQRSTPRVL